MMVIVSSINQKREETITSDSESTDFWT